LLKKISLLILSGGVCFSSPAVSQSVSTANREYFVAFLNDGNCSSLGSIMTTQGNFCLDKILSSMKGKTNNLTIGITASAIPRKFPASYTTDAFYSLGEIANFTQKEDGEWQKEKSGKQYVPLYTSSGMSKCWRGEKFDNALNMKLKTCYIYKNGDLTYNPPKQILQKVKSKK
jgi:hypothetical protein